VLPVVCGQLGPRVDLAREHALVDVELLAGLVALASEHRDPRVPHLRAQLEEADPLPGLALALE